MAFPVGVIMLVVSWFLITHVLHRVPEGVTIDHGVVERERQGLGAISFEERAVLGVFAATALLWVFRVDLQLGFLTVPGWSRILPDPGMIDDGTVAITLASLLFFIPARNRKKGATRVMGPDVIPRLPWNIVLLFGGGFALAAGFQETGLAQLIGSQFEVLGSLPVFVMILLVCAALTFLTEFTSNTATTEMVLPILASVAVVTGTHPLVLMIPATLSAVVRLHDACGDPTQRHRLRQRPDHRGRDGARGHLPQPDRGAGHRDRRLHGGAARLRHRPCDGAGVGEVHGGGGARVGPPTRVGSHSGRRGAAGRSAQHAYRLPST